MYQQPYSLQTFTLKDALLEAFPEFSEEHPKFVPLVLFLRTFAANGVLLSSNSMNGRLKHTHIHTQTCPWVSGWVGGGSVSDGCIAARDGTSQRFYSITRNIGTTTTNKTSSCSTSCGIAFFGVYVTHTYIYIWYNCSEFHPIPWIYWNKDALSRFEL